MSRCEIKSEVFLRKQGTGVIRQDLDCTVEGTGMRTGLPVGVSRTPGRRSCGCCLLCAPLVTLKVQRSARELPGHSWKSASRRWGPCTRWPGVGWKEGKWGSRRGKAPVPSPRAPWLSLSRSHLEEPGDLRELVLQ